MSNGFSILPGAITGNPTHEYWYRIPTQSKILSTFIFVNWAFNIKQFKEKHFNLVKKLNEQL